MKEERKIDFGFVQIHKEAIAEIAASAIKEISGVSLLPKDFIIQSLEWVGVKKVPGIRVVVDENNDVSLQIQVLVRYGLSLPDISRHIQDIVKIAVERMADIRLKDVHVHIRGIERGNP
jgi:uncharacterized alkaline shock family protein YloU